jgi:hypothetical protein
LGTCPIKTPEAGLAGQVFKISIKQVPSLSGLSVITGLIVHNRAVGSRDIVLMYVTTDRLEVTAFGTDICFVGTITMLTGDSVTRVVTKNSCHICTIWAINYFKVWTIGVLRHTEAKVYC